MSADGPQATRWPFILRDPDFKQKVANAKLLCVGAGGIGCELLKTLSLTGFKQIEVIDLDTIDTSNLNRQFLFRKHHVGQAKSKVAAEVVKGFRPKASIVSYQDNIKSPRFDVNYFKQFDIVLNGLDNIEARRHVNRLCLAAEKPLIESGTTGYLGQVRVHLKGVTECYECQKKAVQKSYPICTIRNTPDKPIHCIVWAKDILFQRLFGKVEEVTDLDEVAREGQQEGQGEGEAQGEGEGQQEGQREGEVQGEGQREGEDPEAAAAAAAAAEQEKEETSAFIRQEDEPSWRYAARIFDLVYRQQIQNVLKIDELWTSRAKPKVLQLEELVPDVEALLKGESGASAARSLGLKSPQQVWTVEENARVFLRSIIMFLDTRASELGSAVFEKDDPLAVDFVTAASNLRSECYGIPQQSAFDAKGMAGNIIHAIATTNAIVSGLMATEALKLLAGQPEACVDTYLKGRPQGFSRRGVKKAELIARSPPCGPNPQCVVCGRSQMELQINTETAKMGVLVDKVLKQHLAFVQPYIMLDSSVIYEEGEDLKDEDEDQWRSFQLSLTKTLQELPAGGIKHGSIVSVEDSLQDFKMELIVTHQDIDEEEHPDGFILVGTAGSKPKDTTPLSVLTSGAPSTSGAAQSSEPITSEHTLVMAATDADSAAAAAKGKQPAVSGKRPVEERENGHMDEQAAKRARLDDAAIAAVLAEEEDDVINLLDEDDDGDTQATTAATTGPARGAVAQEPQAMLDDGDEEVICLD